MKSMDKKKLALGLIAAFLIGLIYILGEMLLIMRQGKVLIVLPPDNNGKMIEGKVSRADRAERTGERVKDNGSAH